MTMDMNRRDFLRMGTGTVLSTAMLSTMGGLQRALSATADTSGYKALVCLFMSGGNDGFNWVVPVSSAGHSIYASSRTGMALDASTLLPLNGTASDGNTYGLHPACPELQSLFNGNSAAVLCNVGTLVAPVTAAQARAGSAALPTQLFSHIDQQTLWQTSIADSPTRYGWAGRVSDLYASQGADFNIAMNINVGGPNYLQSGKTTNSYALGPNGASVLNDTSNGNFRGGLRQQAAAAILQQASSDPNLLVSQFAGVQVNAAAKVAAITSAYNAAGDLSTQFPAYELDANLGQQLHQVARVIKARSQIGDARQIFFVSVGSFDTHNSQLNSQNTMLRIVSRNIATFQAAMAELGTTNQVTLFTASDFGRTLGSNGNGTDHAWGSHHMVVGGAVKGGKYYGRMPSLVVNGADDMNSGHIVPTTSTDQYSATLAGWFGVADSDLPALFPNLHNFATADIGFLG